MIELTHTQQEAIDYDGTGFLFGPAGAGKSAALHQRLHRLLRDGEPAYTILVLVAEEEDRQHFVDVLHHHAAGPYADLKIVTYVQLAREMVSLFWPLIARSAGFERPYQPPAFLGYDLAQLLMWRIVTPMLAAGAFADLRLRPQQIVSQLLDTLNRSALNGLPLQEATQRQIQSWVGESDRVVHLRDAADAAVQFRQHCLRESLLDLSLTVRVFDTQVVEHPEFYRYFSERFRHLMVDNVEEQTPAGQHFVETLMGATQTATVAYDAGGGYKRFLAADPAGARRFHKQCTRTFTFDEHFTSNEPLTHLSNLVEGYLSPGPTRKPASRAAEAIVAVIRRRYRREMVLNLIPALTNLIQAEDVPPPDIAIIAPYLDGALQYSLTQALRAAKIPYTLLRRRSSPRDEPRVRAWLTWLALGHPAWDFQPTPYDVAEALSLSIADLDPGRAQLLVDNLYQANLPGLRPVVDLPAAIVDRVGPSRVEAVERLRLWLPAHDNLPLDEFLHRLFNDLLAQPPFQPHPEPEGAAVCAWLVRTAGRLREAADRLDLSDAADVGMAFIEGINKGLVTANPPEMGEPPDPDGVLVSTMYGYLLAGRPVQVQVWLEVAATGWWDIPRQPLSNAFVLTPEWPTDRVWTMEQDFNVRNELLSRIVRGLTARCRGGIILANSDLDRRGQRQDGRLWQALQPILAPLPDAARR